MYGSYCDRVYIVCTKMALYFYSVEMMLREQFLFFIVIYRYRGCNVILLYKLYIAYMREGSYCDRVYITPCWVKIDLYLNVA